MFPGINIGKDASCSPRIRPDSRRCNDLGSIFGLAPLPPNQLLTATYPLLGLPNIWRSPLPSLCLSLPLSGRRDGPSLEYMGWRESTLGERKRRRRACACGGPVRLEWPWHWPVLPLPIVRRLLVSRYLLWALVTWSPWSFESRGSCGPFRLRGFVGCVGCRGHEGLGSRRTRACLPPPLSVLAHGCPHPACIIGTLLGPVVRKWMCRARRVTWAPTVFPVGADSRAGDVLLGPWR